jgi:hypothetical protein
MTELDTPDEILGNFDMGQCFCDVKCVHGHPVRMFNIGRGHYAACDSCKSYVFLGENLKSDWRQENKHIWDLNIIRVSKYRFYG